MLELPPILHHATLSVTLLVVMAIMMVVVPLLQQQSVHALWDLNGAFEVVDDVAPYCSPKSCYQPNPLSASHASCSCSIQNEGASDLTSLSFRVLNSCNGKGTLHGGNINVCMLRNWLSSSSSSFGGAFQKDDTVPNTRGCRVVNPASGGCVCPNDAASGSSSSFEEVSMRVVADCEDLKTGKGCLIGTNVVFCVNHRKNSTSHNFHLFTSRQKSSSSSAVDDGDDDAFQGVFQVRASDEKCLVPNPLANNQCRCPSSADGNKTAKLHVLIDGNVPAFIFICNSGVSSPSKKDKKRVWPPLKPVPVEPLDIFVSVKAGSDSNSGLSPSSPVASVQRALEIISQSRQQKQQKQNVTVHIEPGFYSINETVQINSIHGGSQQFNTKTIFKSYHSSSSSSSSFAGSSGSSGKVIFSGGVRMKLSKKANGTSSIYETKLDRSIFTQEQVYSVWNFDSSSLNSTRCPLFSTPYPQRYLKYDTSSNIITLEQTSPSLLPPNVSSNVLRDALVKIYHSWTSSVSRVQKFAPRQRELFVAGSVPDNRFNAAAGRRFVVMNILLENASDLEKSMTQNSFTFERSSGILRYRPPSSFSSSTSPSGEPEIIVPRLRTVVKVASDAENIIFDSITFSHTDSALDETCLSTGCSGQAGAALTTPVVDVYASRVLFTSCEISASGQYGINFRAASRQNTIEKSKVHDLGAGGIRIGSAARGPVNKIAAGHVVQDCEVFDAGHVIEAGVGVFVQFAKSITIQYNSIHDLYYTSISLSWSWGYSKTPSENLNAAHNRLYNIFRHRLSDGGCIYSLGIQPGSVVENNVCSEVFSYGYGSWNFYTDEGSSYMVFKNNIGYNSKSAALHQHYGCNNIFINNIFALQNYAAGVSPFTNNGPFDAIRSSPSRSGHESFTSFSLLRNIVFINNASESLFYGTTPVAFLNSSDVIDSNVYFNFQKSAADLKFPTGQADHSWAKWQALGRDRNSIRANPLFKNDPRETFDFSELDPKSPALARGFKPICQKCVGPRS